MSSSVHVIYCLSSCLSSILMTSWSAPTCPLSYTCDLANRPCPLSYISSFLHILHLPVFHPTFPLSYMSSTKYILQPLFLLSSSPDTAKNVSQSNLINKNILTFQPPISTLLNLHFILCYCFNWYSTRSNPRRLWGVWGIGFSLCWVLTLTSYCIY